MVWLLADFKEFSKQALQICVHLAGYLIQRDIGHKISEQFVGTWGDPEASGRRSFLANLCKQMAYVLTETPSL